MEDNYILLPVDPETFEYQEYSESDENIIPTQSIDTEFSQDSDYIEFYVYDDNQDLQYPLTDDVTFTAYSVREGDIELNPARDLRNEGFYEGNYFAVYNFYRKRLASDISQRYYINGVSSDRTEIILQTNLISDEEVVNSTNEFIEYRNSQDYFVDFQLNFGLNRTVIANNIQLDDSLPDVPKVLIKLYEPLPQAFQLKDTLWVVEEIATPQAYRLEFPFVEVEGPQPDNLQGPNFNIDVTQQVGQASEVYNYNQITSTNLTSSLQQLQSLLEEKGIQINVNYEKREDFIKLSSAKARLENFHYKASLIEQTQNTLSSSIYNVRGGITGSTSFSQSKASLESIINSTIKNFDGYEYFLYYNSGSKYSWPKASSLPPYKLQSTGSTEVLNWYGSENEGSIYYGGQVVSASEYDENNPEWLYRTIPEYLVEDPDNAQYELFIDMIGQHFDNIWIYTKDVTNRFNADNRLDYGISKDLVADAIKDFGLKLYSANYDQNDLFEAFLGIRADGDPFLVNNIINTLPVASGSGEEYITSQISASSDTIPLNDVQKSIYKRIYHNLPYLLKTKGTLAGMKALITSFGVPDTILETNEYGGSIRPWNNARNQYQERTPVFNYALSMRDTVSVETPFELNAEWSASNARPETILFRIKPEYVTQGSSPTNARQKIMSFDTGLILSLDYDTPSNLSGSYSGSVRDPQYQFGTLNLYPEGIGPVQPSASVFLPFFNGDWWSVSVRYVDGDGYILTSQNRYYDDTANPTINYSEVASVQLTGSTSWVSASAVNYGSQMPPSLFYSGSLQEIRYYTAQIGEAQLRDFTMNPQSFTGTGTNLSPDQLAFRATLGGELYTGSESVHPRISGSW
jgi:hypothetical protein